MFLLGFDVVDIFFGPTFACRTLGPRSGPWVVFGCSYSGALSSWFRLKFPQACPCFSCVCAMSCHSVRACVGQSQRN